MSVHPSFLAQRRQPRFKLPPSAPDRSVFNRIIDRIKSRGWHVVLHLDAPDIVPLAPMIRALPLPFVIDHIGRMPVAGGVEQPPLRVLWGTDFPHPNATHEADEADLVDLVPQFAATPLAQRRLLVDNPARLYGFA